MNRNLRLASTLFSSSVVGQLAVLCALSLAASRVQPAAFASFGVVSAGAYVLASCNTLGAELRSTVVDEDDAYALTRTGAAVAACLTVMAGLLGCIAAASGYGHVGGVLALTGACAWMLGMQQLLNGLVLRDERQELLARNRFVQAFSNAALILVSLITPAPAWLGLSFAWLTSLVIGNCTLALAQRARLRCLGRPRKGDLTRLLSEVKLQPLANLMASSTAQLPVFALQAMGATAIVGAWTLAVRFLQPIVNTAVSTLQPIYYGRMAHLLRNRKWAQVDTHHRVWMIRLAGVGLLATGAFAVVLWWVIPMMGPGWNIARTVAVPAVIHFATLIVCVPLSQTLVLLGRPNAQFTWTITRLAMCLAPLALAPWVGPSTALLGWAVVSSLTFLCQLALHRWAIAGLDDAEPS